MFQSTCGIGAFAFIADAHSPSKIQRGHPLFTTAALSHLALDLMTARSKQDCLLLLWHIHCVSQRHYDVGYAMSIYRKLSLSQRYAQTSLIGPEP